MIDASKNATVCGDLNFRFHVIEMHSNEKLLGEINLKNLSGSCGTSQTHMYTAN